MATWHTPPGVLALLERHVPQAELWLWPSSLSDGADALLRARFPQLRICQTASEKAEAMQTCDFLLHGSGPSLVGWKEVEQWSMAGKPYGVYGITVGAPQPKTVELLSGSQFVYLRDSVSVQACRDAGVTSPVVDFAPDGAFACDVANDLAADRWLAEHQVQPGRFLCCIPRLRYTPYWLLYGRAMTDEDRRRERHNLALADHDHAPLRDAIAAVIRQTDARVLLCPEDRSQMAVGQEWVLGRLPPDVRSRVAWRSNFWSVDEALSVYRKSCGVFGLEQHSPILCIGSGVPALVGRFAEQTSKGFMWRDIGLSEWLFDFDAPDDLARLTATVLSLVTDRRAALATAAAARERVAALQRHTMLTVAAELG